MRIFRKIGQLLASLGRIFSDPRDFLFFGGLCLLGYGLWLHKPWLGYAVPGAVLTLFGMFVWVLGLFIRPKNPPERR